MQEIITYLIVSAAVVTAIYKIYLALPLKPKTTSNGKCGNCASDCSLKDLHQGQKSKSFLVQ